MRIELCYNITVAGVLEFFGVFEMEGQSEMYGRGLQKHKKISFAQNNAKHVRKARKVCKNVTRS